MRKSYFCICHNAQIRVVSTQVDKRLCFFATLIETLPALFSLNNVYFESRKHVSKIQ